MAILRQLLEPETYRPCDWDLGRDHAGRARWCELFRWHLDATLLPLMRAEYPDATEQTLAEFRAEYRALYDDVEARPDTYAPLDILRLTSLRRGPHSKYNFPDPFHALKSRENATALELLPGVLAELDGADEHQRRELLVAGLMAGNIFDLGSKATIELHADGNTSFRATRDTQPQRPWFIDDVKAWWQHWDKRGGYEHVVFFIDNCGGDIVLGCLPWARWLVQAGARVTLAANSEPALNDITAAELELLLQLAGDHDDTLTAALRSGQLCVRATGSVTPLIDLTQLSDEFVDATADADLIYLHGMGRGIESNFHAAFICDQLTTAVLKDESVAARIGGSLFDCVFRWRRAR